MCVCDPPGLSKVGTHEQDTVLRADRPVERGARGPALPGELQALAEQRAGWGEGPPGMPDLVHAPADAGDGSAKRVAEKLRAGGHGPRGPWRALLLRGFRHCVKQGAEQKQRCEAVGENVVEADEHRYVPIQCAGEQPDLPQGVCLVKRPAVQLHAGRQQCFLAATGRRGPRPDMAADIEPRVVDPDWGAEAETGPVEPLTKPRCQVQALLDPHCDRLNGKLSRRIEQNAALEDGEGGNVHRQAMPLDAKVADIERGQPLEDQTVSAHRGSSGRGAPPRHRRVRVMTDQPYSLAARLSSTSVGARSPVSEMPSWRCAFFQPMRSIMAW